MCDTFIQGAELYSGNRNVFTKSPVTPVNYVSNDDKNNNTANIIVIKSTV